MAKIPAKYKTEAEIPAGIKDYYVKSGDEWFLDYGDDVAAMTNPGLERNKNSLKTEKLNLEIELEQSKLDLRRAKVELESARLSGNNTGGQPILTADELTAVSEIKKVVALAEVPKRLTEFDALKTKATQLEQKETIRTAAGSADLDPEILADLLSHPERGKGLSLISENVVEGEGEEKTTTTEWLVKRKNADQTVEKFKLADAPDKLWKPYANSLRKTAGENNGGGTENTNPTFVIPRSGPTQNGKDTKQKKGEDPIGDMVANFNAARNAVPNPLAPKPQGQ